MGGSFWGASFVLKLLAGPCWDRSCTWKTSVPSLVRFPISEQIQSLCVNQGPSWDQGLHQVHVQG